MEEGEGTEQAEGSKAEAKQAALLSGPDRHDDQPEAKQAGLDLEPGSGKREGSSASGFSSGDHVHAHVIVRDDSISVAAEEGSSIQQYTGSGAIPKSRGDRPGSPRFDFKGGTEAKYVIQGVYNLNLYEDRADRLEAKRARLDLESGSGNREGSSVQQHTGSGAIPKSRGGRPDRPEAKRATQDPEPGSRKREGSSVCGLSVGGHAQVGHVNVYGSIAGGAGGSSVQQYAESRAIPKSIQDMPDRILLDGSFCYFPNKRISKQVFHGEQTAARLGPYPIAVKIELCDKYTLRETKNLLELGKHQNVVNYIHSGTNNDEQIMFLAMELCHQQNLRQYTETRRERGDPFDRELAINHAKQIVAGLAHIHDHDIIHRDLKPDNILFSLNQRNLKISDFGFSKEIGTHSTSLSSSGQAGTDGYRAPEVITNGHISKKADIFSVGLVLHYIWSYGEHPYGPEPASWNLNIRMDLNPEFSGLMLDPKVGAQNLLGWMLSFAAEKRPSIQRVEKDGVLGGLEKAPPYLPDGFRSFGSTTARVIPYKYPTTVHAVENPLNVHLNVNVMTVATKMSMIEHRKTSDIRVSTGIESGMLEKKKKAGEDHSLLPEQMQPTKPDNEE